MTWQVSYVHLLSCCLKIHSYRSKERGQLELFFMYEITILTGSKNNHKIKVAETLQWPVGSWHAPLGLQMYYFIILENADHIDYLYGEVGEEGVLRRGCKSKTG